MPYIWSSCWDHPNILTKMQTTVKIISLFQKDVPEKTYEKVTGLHL